MQKEMEEEDVIFDTHAHYDDEAYEEDREDILKLIRQDGVGLVTDVGATIASTKKAVALSEQYDFIYAAVGMHPEGVEELTDQDMDWLYELAKREKVVAIGEIGLDYYYEDPKRDIQKIWFRKQLEVARKTGLPVVIHSRDAAQDTLDIIKEEHGEQIGGVIHCFSYGKEMAQVYLDMGFYLGIGGVVTFKNGKKLKEVVKYTPIERIVLETDAPYLTPEPNRGKRNASHYLKYVAQEIAQLKGMTAKEVIAVTTKNAKEMYRI